MKANKRLCTIQFAWIMRLYVKLEPEPDPDPEPEPGKGDSSGSSQIPRFRAAPALKPCCTVCTLYSTVLVHCSYEFVFKVLQCMFWMWLMVVIVPHRILCMLYKVYIYNLLISLQYPEIFMFHMTQTILKLVRYLRRWIKAECCLSHLYHTFFITIFQLPKNNWGQKSIDEQEMTQRCTGAHPNSNESKLRRCRGQC